MALEEAKGCRNFAARSQAPAIPVRSSERELRGAINKLVNRILLLEKIVEERERENARLRHQILTADKNVVAFATR
jgi:hypothetical protein